MGGGGPSGQREEGSLLSLSPPRVPAGPEWRVPRRHPRHPQLRIDLGERRSTGALQLQIGGPRVYRVYPNPNPKLRVPELSGSDFSELKSGSIFYYPNFVLPELPDPKNSGNPNAQS